MDTIEAAADKVLWLAVRQAALQIAAAQADRLGMSKYLGPAVDPIAESELVLIERRAWMTIASAIERRYHLPSPRPARRVTAAPPATEYTGSG